MKPVIGILFCGFDEKCQYVSNAYIEAVSLSGGIPILIPYSDSPEDTTDSANSKQFYKYFDICDGFLFCGGHDVTPILFGEELMTDIGHTDLKADRFHIHFMQELISSKLPVLAICRGMQILNLALGGTVYQDISLRLTSSLNHMQNSSERSDICHKICIQKSSMLYKICGSSLYVNSFHHQCIKTLGNNLVTTAIASDGIAEAIELPSHPFALGVQWHPECMYHTDFSMKNLFITFINVSKNSKKLFLI
ncbi:MAG: gamma-glutamyl-gamma-aminobutyrate hydrolase family protein [Lachnospiraceae bacterium]